MPSSLSRLTLDHNFDQPKTMFQAGQYGGNIGISVDYNAGNYTFNNAWLDGRGYSEWYNGNLIASNLDETGHPTNGQWLSVTSVDFTSSTGEIVNGNQPPGIYTLSYQTDPGVVRALYPLYDTRFIKDVVQADGITHHLTYEVPIVRTAQGQRISGVVGWCGHPNFAQAGGFGAPGLRNIIMPREGFTLETMPQELFHPRTINYYRQWNKLRFLDAQSINYYPNFGTISWDDIPSMATKHGGYARRADSTLNKHTGFPPDALVTLINESYAASGSIIEGAWFHIPHLADNNYVTEFLKIIRDNLNPDIQVWLEYSNEVWNYSFTQGSWNLENARNNIVQLNLDYDITPPAVGDDNVRRSRMCAHKGIEISNEANRLWAETPTLKKPYTVLAWQFAGAPFYRTMMRYCEHITQKPFNETFHCISIAPYFGPNSTQDSNKTPQEYVAAFERDYLRYGNWLYESLNENKGGTKYFKELATEFQTKLDLYEFGMDYGSLSLSDRPNLNAALYSPEFRDVVKRATTQQLKWGVDDMNWFSISLGAWLNNTVQNFAVNPNIIRKESPLQGIMLAGNSIPPGPEDIEAWNKILPTGDNEIIGKYWINQSDDDYRNDKTPLVLQGTPFVQRASRPSNSKGGFFGGIRVVNWRLYEDFYPYQERWVTWAPYVEEAGTYEIELYGSGGTPKTVARSITRVMLSQDGSDYSNAIFPVASSLYLENGAQVHDRSRDGNFIWELWHRQSQIEYNKLGVFGSPPSVSIGEFLSPVKVTVNLPQGWQSLKLLGKLERGAENVYAERTTMTQTIYQVESVDPVDGVKYLYNVPRYIYTVANASIQSATINAANVRELIDSYHIRDGSANAYKGQDEYDGLGPIVPFDGELTSFNRFAPIVSTTLNIVDSVSIANKVNSISVINPSTNFNTGFTLDTTVTFSQPDDPRGIQARGVIRLEDVPLTNEFGAILRDEYGQPLPQDPPVYRLAGITITEPGSGYTTTPILSFSDGTILNGTTINVTMSQDSGTKLLVGDMGYNVTYQTDQLGQTVIGTDGKPVISVLTPKSTQHSFAKFVIRKVA